MRGGSFANDWLSSDRPWSCTYVANHTTLLTGLTEGNGTKGATKDGNGSHEQPQVELAFGHKRVAYHA